MIDGQLLAHRFHLPELVAQDVIVLEAPVGGSEDVANAEGEAFWADHESSSVMSPSGGATRPRRFHAGAAEVLKAPSRRDGARDCARDLGGDQVQSPSWRWKRTCCARRGSTNHRRWRSCLNPITQPS